MINFKETLMDNALELHDLVWFLITGGLAGWIAGILVEGSGMGIFGGMVVGIAGAFLGGYFAYRIRIPLYGYWEVPAMSILGAMILLAVFRVFTPSKRTS
jgi:uncharacterized membrane protein YeaQ/YmgE (transglycosylase-associated protein family)